MSATGSQLWMQGTPGVPGNGEPWDSFGHTLVAADFDGDGRADLAIGTELEDFGGVSNAGVVTILRGAATGLTTAGAQQWSQDSAGVPGVAEPDGFGSTLAAGDFGRSALPDLAVGVEGETAGGQFATGIVDVLYARTGGLSGLGAQSWWLDSPGSRGSRSAGASGGVASRPGRTGQRIGHLSAHETDCASAWAHVELKGPGGAGAFERGSRVGTD